MKLYLTIVSILLPFFLFAQPSKEERTELAKAAIQTLKNETLVVRLPSYHRKITELNRLINSPEVSEKSKNRLRKILMRNETNLKAFNTLLQTTIAEEYTFSNVAYIYDTASVALRKHTSLSIFLDKFLEPKPRPESLSNEWFMLEVVYDGLRDGPYFSGLRVLNQSGEVLPAPFPDSYRFDFFEKMLNLFTNDGLERQRRQMVRSVRTLQTRLEDLYQRYHGENKFTESPTTNK